MSYEYSEDNLIEQTAIDPGFDVLSLSTLYLDKPLKSHTLMQAIARATYYVIDGQTLKYHSAFIKGEIKISNIREIIKGQTTWVGIKPALARKGLIIKFNKFDEIYISPISNDMMISDLIEINPNIKII